MMTFPRWYHNDFTKNPPNPARAATKTPANPPTAEESRAAHDRENFEKLFEAPELSLLIMRKIWQWQIERWGDPAKDRGCTFHVHSNTQCEYKKAGVASTSSMGGAKAGASARSLNSSPNNPAALLQGISGSRGQGNWMSAPNSAAAGLIGGWHPGVGW
jgi:hypothetical protein